MSSKETFLNNEKKTNQKDNVVKELEEEIDDYMSNDILNQISDTRPGLVYNRSTARKYELEKKHDLKSKQNRQIPVKELEQLNRDEALKTSTLVSSNKGFNLMLKMGYKTGEGLGKISADLESSEPSTKKKLIEPISVEIKANREGLGQLSERKIKLHEIEELRKLWNQKKIESEKNIENLYLSSKRSMFNLRKIRFNFHKCQRVAYQLDSTKGNLKEPEIKWFWPRNIMKAIKAEKCKEIETEVKYTEALEEVEEICLKTELRAQEEQSVVEIKDNSKIDLKLVYQERLNSFLSENIEKNETVLDKNRVKESDEEEDEELSLDINNYSEKVRIEKEKNEGEDLSDREDEDDFNDNEEILSRKVDSICMYLKEKYLYCVWCAQSYNCEQEMNSNCPGLTEKDHEFD